MAIYRGDQYSLPFGIKMGKQIVTPENSADVVIALGDLVKSYGKFELTFDNEVYYFPLTTEETLNMADDVSAQVQVKINNDIIHSREFSVKIKPIKDVLRKRLENNG